MKSLLTVAFLLFVAATANAQIPATIVNFRYDSPNLAFDGVQESSAQAQQNGYITRVIINGQAPQQVIATCTGSVKPWRCEIANVPFQIGHNVLYVTIQRNQPCTPPEGATPDYCSESGFSNPLTVFHAVSQREVITNTQIQTTIRCMPGTYQVKRITNAAVLQTEANAITGNNVISNILATSNAIYIFSCTPTQ